MHLLGAVGRAARRADGWMNKWVGGWMVWVDGLGYGWIEGWADGMGELMDGWMGVRLIICNSYIKSTVLKASLYA